MLSSERSEVGEGDPTEWACRSEESGIKENIGPAAAAPACRARRHCVSWFGSLSFATFTAAVLPCVQRGRTKNANAARTRPCRQAGEVEQRYITDSARSKPAVWCFVSSARPHKKSSAQPQIGRTAGLEPVRLDAYIGEMIRLSPMRNIGAANIKTHLSLSTENLQYYGAVTCAVLRRPLSYDRSLLFFPSSPFLHLHPRRPR